MKKKYIINIIAFILPVFMILGYIIYMELITNHNFFFDGHSFLAADMKFQYNYLYSYVHNVMAGNDSIFYSFYNSLGGNMISTIGYYLASPFNILYGFVCKADFPITNVIIHTLKLGMCSLCMNIFLNYKFGYKKSNLIFSLTYAFIGINAIYYFNILWQDVIYMTPLVIMGIEKLIKGKPFQYIICLALSIIFNFYMAYILCVFCCLYFIYELLIQYKLTEFKKYYKIIIGFSISSILAFGLSFFFTLPLILNLQQMFRFPIDHTKLHISFHNFYQTFIYKIISNIYLGGPKHFSLLFRERPIIYVGLFSFLLFILYFFNKKINKREKILSLGIVLIFLVTFLIPHLQLVWQAFSFPNGYTDRYAYLFSFFMIILAAKQFYSNENPKILKMIILVLIYIIVGITIINNNYNYMKNSHILLCLSFFTIYSFIYIIICRLKENKTIFKYILFIVIIFELIYNYGVVKVLSDQYTGGNNYRPFYTNICSNLTNLENNYYRLEGSVKISNLDSHLCLYHGMSNELSTNNKKLYEFMDRNGAIALYIHIYYDKFKLPVLDSLLGIKYVTDRTLIDYYNYKLYKNIKTDGFGDLFIYQNPNALSLGYVVDQGFNNHYHKNNGSKLDNLNNLVKSMSGIKEDILSKVLLLESKKSSKIYYIDRNVDKVYLTTDHELSHKYSRHGELFLNDKFYKDIEDKDAAIDIINDVEKGDKIKLSVKNNVDITDFSLYYFNEENFYKAISILKQHQLQNVKANKNKLSGEIDLDKSSKLLMTIPYDKGWNVYIDGKKVPYSMIADTFISIDIPKGHHKIKMVFYPQGLVLGIVVSCFSTLITILLFFGIRKKDS